MLNFARSIVETVRHPLLVLTPELEVVSANSPYYRVFRIAPECAIGRNLFELDEGKWNLPRLRGSMDKLIEESQSFEDLEVAYESPHLGRRIMLLNARYLSDTPDRTPAVLLAIEDDTEHRQHHKWLQRSHAELESQVAGRTLELKAANERLQAANRELEAFCYSVSHDLRAPLRAVDGFSQELMESYADRLDEQGLHYLRRIRAGVQRMGRLIDDLLKLSRLSRTEMSRESVDLSALAHAIAEDLQRETPDRKIAFDVEPGLKAQGDPDLLQVALENLLGNAWKFTSRRSAAAVVLGLERQNGRSLFFVRDNGVGFDPKYRHKLFGAFQRLHSEQEFAGTGIGLATVHRIIHRHGGEIWAEGTVNQGATFYFTLPGLRKHGEAASHLIGGGQSRR